ncbi:unnamed protein product, partial [Effrenium voratum]
FGNPPRRFIPRLLPRRFRSDGSARWIARSRQELFLDTTYCTPRWRFPPQSVACDWLREITRQELQREPRTLFVVGCYQIGKERAAQAVAEAANSAVFVEPRRWKVLQLAGWGDTRLPSGQPLWSIDKEGCCVWMGGLGGLAHDVLKHFLASTKGQFEAVVAFSPTGWTWTKAMAQNACAGCRCWMENEGRTRVYSVPYSEHSSYEELLALVNGLRPKRLIPTVNSETRESKERMMAPFLELLDLKGDRERMDHYLYGSSSSSCKLEAEDSFVDVLSLSTACKAEVLRTPSAPSKPAPKLWRGFRLARQPRPKAVDLDSEDSTTAGGSSSSSPKATCPAPSQLSGALAKRRLVVDLDSEEAAPAPSAGASAAESPAAEELPTALDDLRCVDLDLQKRLLRFFESAKAPEAPKAGLKKPKQPKSKGKGKGKSKSESQAPVLKHLGVRPKEEPKPKKRRAAKPSARTGREKRTKTESTAADPKQPGEKRPARFVPKPSARVQERIDRAFGHRLYFLARAPAEGGEKLDVLGSTGNVYHVELRSQGNACSCLDFAKGGGVCKHLLFVMLRVLKLARDDHRVWQSGLTESELQPLLSALRSSDFQGVQADATVMRGYQQAAGGGGGAARQPLPADCPICFEEILSESGASDFCRVCGHNLHTDCQRRWAASGNCGDTCPMCRSPWSLPASSSVGALSIGPVVTLGLQGKWE